MRPLVYYCRWQKASLRLQGRDENAVWGFLVYTADNGTEDARQFHYRIDKAELTIQIGGKETRLLLDDKGIPLPQQG